MSNSLFTFPYFYKTGHRGCRGIYPENTIVGFLKAIALGANTIELDVVVNKDRELLVSHEPYMHHEFCLKPDGTEITETEEKRFNLFLLSQEEIKQFDCGSKPHPRFPHQEKVREQKPLLSEVIDATSLFLETQKHNPIVYDIEIKSEAPEYGISQPMPDVFAKLIVDFIQKYELEKFVIIRSFDPIVLQQVHILAPALPIALIVENNLSVKENISLLGFAPFMYSPDYTLLSSNDIEFLRKAGIKTVPWTVNTKEDVEKMLGLQVDGIITDYPHLFNYME